MDAREQARLSGLVLGSNEQEPPLWTRNDQDWPPLERYEHASVVVHPPNNNKEQIAVVVGGRNQEDIANNSVLLLRNTAEQSTSCRKWIEGPAMNETRQSLAAVICNGSLYAIGGRNDRRSVLKTIERIDIIDLLAQRNRDKENLWESLTCQLSEARDCCCADTIHNRYIVVAGGWGVNMEVLASVEIIDSMQESQPHVLPGPPLKVPRRLFGMTVIGSCIYVVGGLSRDLEAEALKSVEYLKLSDSSGELTSNKATLVVQPSSAWMIHEDLSSILPRWGHAVVRVGSCLVVSGGLPRITELTTDPLLLAECVWSVEVMDTKRNKVWKMVPEMTGIRVAHTMVTLSTGIVCISGGLESSSEKLSLMDKNSVVFRNLLLGKNGTCPCLKEM